MAKLPAFAKAFAGRWRIVEMDVWDKDFLDLVETAHLTFKGGRGRRNRLRRTEGLPRCSLRHPRRARCAEFSWEGNDENDPASVVDGSSLALQAASSDTSTSTTARI